MEDTIFVRTLTVFMAGFIIIGLYNCFQIEDNSRDMVGGILMLSFFGLLILPVGIANFISFLIFIFKKEKQI